MTCNIKQIFCFVQLWLNVNAPLIRLLIAPLLPESTAIFGWLSKTVPCLQTLPSSLSRFSFQSHKCCLSPACNTSITGSLPTVILHKTRHLFFHSIDDLFHDISPLLTIHTEKKNHLHPYANIIVSFSEYKKKIKFIEISSISCICPPSAPRSGFLF